MSPAHPAIARSNPASFGLRHSWVAFLLVVGMLLAGIIAGSHHHDDADRHHGCAVCSAAQVPGTAPDSPTLPEIIRPVQAIRFALLVLDAPVFKPTALLRSRAPPR